MLLVDTNVLVDVLEDEPEWADWSISQLRAQSKIHPLAINPVIYAELSLTFSTVEALDKAIENLGMAVLELPRPALFLAGKAFVRYRRQRSFSDSRFQSVANVSLLGASNWRYCCRPDT